MSDNNARDFAHAFRESQLMNDMHDYIQRGRRFEAVATPELNKMWIAVVQAMAAERGDARACLRDFDDTSAEFQLRGVEPPVDAVLDEIEVLQSQLKPMMPLVLPALEEKLYEFLAYLVEPKN
jgi:hypothetical protein